MKGSHEHGRSSGWSSKGSAREIAEEDEDEVYVAVVKDVKEGKANFLWLLHNTPEDKKVVVVHVHRPAQKIPTGVCFSHPKLRVTRVAGTRSCKRCFLLLSQDTELPSSLDCSVGLDSCVPSTGGRGCSIQKH